MKNQNIIDDRASLAKIAYFYGFIYDFHGENAKIVCPFHKDINPSLMLNFTDNRWFCFGCNLSGDAFEFVKLIEEKYNGLNDLQAYIKYLKILKSDEVQKLRIHKFNKSENEIKIIKDKEYEEAYYLFKGLKTVDWNSYDLNDEEQKCLNYMKDRGFNEKALNLCNAKASYEENYPIVFPMMDNGLFAGWVKRTMSKEVEKKRKYLYNKGFKRATTLVGNYGKKSYVCVVEGYMDWLKLRQFGIDNCVAILGWKMSIQQINKLKNVGIDTIFSFLDNDECGIKGTNYLKDFFNVIRIRFPKDIKDIGEMDIKMFYKFLEQKKKKFLKQTKEKRRF